MARTLAELACGTIVLAVALAPRSVLPPGTWAPLLAVLVAATALVVFAGLRGSRSAPSLATPKEEPHD